jgi:aminomethyltransferase
MIDRGIPRHGYEIVDTTGKVIGVVTSGTQSPTLQKAIGMGYVSSANAQIGTELFIRVRDKDLKALIVRLPFINKKSE